MNLDGLILGENMVLMLYKGGEYVPYACATEVSIETRVETKKVRTLGDGKWNKPRAQSWSYGISVSGLLLIDGTKFTSWDFQNALMGGGLIDFRMVFEDPITTLVKVMQGKALLTSSLLAGASTGFATGDFDLEGDGAYELLDSVLGCNAGIDFVSVGTILDGVPGQAIIHYEGAHDHVRIDYEIDGGGRQSVFGTAPNGFIYVNDMYGEHVLVITPICENGEDGQSLTEPFIIE
jgi:hypothetical protein